MRVRVRVRGKGVLLPAGHRQQLPARRPQLPPLKRRRAGGRAPEKVRRAVHLHRHLSPAEEDHLVRGRVTVRIRVRGLGFGFGLGLGLGLG